MPSLLLPIEICYCLLQRSTFVLSPPYPLFSLRWSRSLGRESASLTYFFDIWLFYIYCVLFCLCLKKLLLYCCIKFFYVKKIYFCLLYGHIIQLYMYCTCMYVTSYFSCIIAQLKPPGYNAKTLQQNLVTAFQCAQKPVWSDKKRSHTMYLLFSPRKCGRA